MKIEIDKVFENHASNMPWLKERTIFVSLHGSRAYGTNIATSDIDIKGIVIPPKEQFLGMLSPFKVANGNYPFDYSLFDIKEFLKMASEAHPNVLELLFTDKEDWIYSNNLFLKLHSNRNLFLSQKILNPFLGYAYSQLEKVDNCESTKSCKHAYQVVRLTRMCREVLTTGELIVKRPDFKDLVEIRNGKWFLENLKDWFFEEKNQLRKLSSSILPERPDMQKISKLCMELVEESFEKI
jgi:predicted nucleotidyltransferase